MLWLLVLHISAVICWCGSLLYLLALTAGTASKQLADDRERRLDLMLMIYRLFATPCALIAVISGTAIFITTAITEHWLVLKLTLVAALVSCHAISGWIILHTQKSPGKNLAFFSVLLGGVVVLLIPAIVWVVLTKPF